MPTPGDLRLSSLLDSSYPHTPFSICRKDTEEERLGWIHAYPLRPDKVQEVFCLRLLRYWEHMRVKEVGNRRGHRPVAGTIRQVVYRVMLPDIHDPSIIGKATNVARHRGTNMGPSTHSTAIEATKPGSLRSPSRKLPLEIGE